MRPILFSFYLPVIGKVVFPAFFTMASVAMLTSLYVVLREARRLGLPAVKLYDFGVMLVLVGLLGARLLHVVADGKFYDYVHLCTDPKQVEVPVGPGGPETDHCTADTQCGKGFLCNRDTSRCYPERDCLAWLKLWRGGLAVYGGFLLAIPFAFWFIRRERLPFWKTADIYGLVLPLGIGIGRIGCTLHGCCYGRVTDVPWAVRYLRWRGPWEDHVKEGLISASSQYSLYVHPTQLYSALYNVLIFLVAYTVIRRHKRFDGQVLAFVLMAYAVSRFVVEFYRADPRGSVGFLSTSQFIGIIMFALGAWIWKSGSSRSAAVR